MAFWSKTAPPSSGVAPIAVCAHNCAEITEQNSGGTNQRNSQVYIFGGWTGTRMICDLYIFHTATMTWSRPNTTGSSSPRAGHTMTAVGKKILIFGGSDNGIFFNDLQILDTEKMEWSLGHVSGTPPTARSRHSANLLGNKLFIFGGGDERKLFNDLHCLDITTLRWTRIETKGAVNPSPRWGHTSTLVDNKLYIFAGHDGAKRLNDIHILNLETMEWNSPDTSKQTSVPPPRAGHTADLVGRKIFVFGGGDGYVLNDLYALEVDSCIWSKINCTSPGRCAHSSVAIDGKLFIFGGGNGIRCFKDMYIFDGAEYLKMEEAKQAKLKNKLKVKQKLEVLLEQKFKQRELPPDHASNESSVNNAPRPPQPPSIPTPPVSPPILQLPAKVTVSSPPQRKQSKNSKDIRAWLQELGLEQYTNNFLREEIDMDIVHCLKEHHLIQMGIDGLRPRLVLLAAIEQIRNNQNKNMILDLKKQQSQLLNVAEALTLVAKALNDTASTLGQIGVKPS